MSKNSNHSSHLFLVVFIVMIATTIVSSNATVLVVTISPSSRSVFDSYIYVGVQGGIQKKGGGDEADAEPGAVVDFLSFRIRQRF
jgi:hypothetical protein